MNNNTNRNLDPHIDVIETFARGKHAAEPEPTWDDPEIQKADHHDARAENATRTPSVHVIQVAGRHSVANVIVKNS